MDCLNCGNLIQDHFSFHTLFTQNKHLLCDTCFKGLEKVQNGCICCGKKTNETVCSDCLYWQKLEATKGIHLINYSMYYYNDIAKNMIEKMKFSGDIKILLAFKNQLKRFIKEKKLTNYSIIPIPLHEERLKERGFNQSYYLAKLLGLSILDIIVKLDNSRQSKKTRAERICFDNQFELKEDCEIRCKNILIVDDIYTTGATIHKVAKLVFDKNIQKIASLTLFRS